MVTYLDDRMVNTHNGKGDLKPANPNGNRLRCLVMSRMSCYGIWWPTLRMLAMG
jgi:hypothetical protein